MDDPYKVLGVKTNSTLKEIRTAYRKLVKQYHPDAGGDEEKILKINAAWEILSDQENRQAYDLTKKVNDSLTSNLKYRDDGINEANNFINSIKNKIIEEENELLIWVKTIYLPIDKSIGQIINAFPSKIRALSADPYEDSLMEDFCSYIDLSKKKIERVDKLYRSIVTPTSAKELSLKLYHCFSQVSDAINEFQLYTKGYVDDYLHDGTEMIRAAKIKRKELQDIKRNLPLY